VHRGAPNCWFLRLKTPHNTPRYFARRRQPARRRLCRLLAACPLSPPIFAAWRCGEAVAAAIHQPRYCDGWVIDELIHLAKDLRDAGKRGEKLKLTDDELAFCHALAQDESTVQVLGAQQLAIIARELVEKIRQIRAAAARTFRHV